jgi:DNA-binding LacI/PurR family transcriptional regulator
MSQFAPRPTLADVAARAGVSTVTVSRVVEGSPKVADTTRDRVEAAMRDLGYYGNAAARQLVSGQSRTIGLVTANTVDYGYGAVLAGIEEAARAHDWTALIVVISGEGPAAVERAVATIASRGLAGAIVIDFDPLARAVLTALPAYLPVVAATGPQPGPASERPSVGIDEYEGSVAAAHHLIDRGHRSIFILGSPHDVSGSRRSRGVQDALQAARLPHYPVVRCATWQPAAGHAAATALLDHYGSAVTALACANDELALGAMRAITDLGLRVPEDISVVGCDDHPIAAFCRPALTTVRQDFRALGRAAFTLLARLLDDTADDRAEAVQPALVIRQSTAPPHPARGWPQP